MSVTTRTQSPGFLTHTLTSGDDEVGVSAFGGQILSWTRAGVPIVLENRERAIMDGKTPYRGGAPICFPYFGPGTLLPLGTSLSPQHGHARTSIWDSTVNDAETSVTLATHQETSGGYGPTEFFLEVTYKLSHQLFIQAKIRNLGDNEAPFQLAIHTYWETQEPAAAVVHGLGERYLDNLLHLSEHEDADSTRPHPTPVDRVYPDAANFLSLKTEHYRLAIETSGCRGAVLWNPGPHHTLADLGSPDFICLECGVIAPGQRLPPHAEHRVEITYGVDLN